MKKFIFGVISAILSAIIVAALLGVWNDFFFKSCNLTGCWEMQLTYDKTAKSSFKGMTVNYDLILSQNNTRLVGHGEKASDDGREKISRENKTKLELEGGVTYKVFSNNEIYLFYFEKNPNGKNGLLNSSTVLSLKKIHKNKMIGTFRSTIANTEGKATLTRKKPGSA